MLTITLAVGSFYVKKWFNYTFYYEDNIKTEMAPILDRINSLEKGYAVILEKNILILEQSKRNAELDAIILKQQKEIIKKLKMIEG